MTRICIIGGGFLGEHLCKYFTENYLNDEVTYCTYDCKFDIINKDSYKAVDISNISSVKNVDFMISCLYDLESIQKILSYCMKLNIKHYHQVLHKDIEQFTSVFKSYPFKVTFSQACQLYGPGQSLSEDLPLWINQGLENNSIEIKKNYERNWLFVIDYCNAIDFILKESNHSEIYLVSTNIKVKDIEMVKMVLNLLNKNIDIRIEDDRIYDKTVECTTMNLLGWEPKHTLDQAIRLTIQWYVLDNLSKKMKTVIQLATKR